MRPEQWTRVHDPYLMNNIHGSGTAIENGVNFEKSTSLSSSSHGSWCCWCSCKLLSWLLSYALVATMKPVSISTPYQLVFQFMYHKFLVRVPPVIRTYMYSSTFRNGPLFGKYGPIVHNICNFHSASSCSKLSMSWRTRVPSLWSTGLELAGDRFNKKKGGVTIFR